MSNLIRSLLLLRTTASAASAVISLPPTVTAGVATNVKFNFSASSCAATFSSERGCDWPLFKLWLTADPKYGGTIINPFCLLSPCISTNLTNFDITIPTSAMPSDNTTHRLVYELFKPLPNGTYDTYNPIWSAFESTSFLIAGSTTNWTNYDLSNRFSQDNIGRPWFVNLSCEALECARRCADRIEAPLVPYVVDPNPELDKCVEACPGFGADPTKCITKDATAAISTTASSSATRGSSSTRTTSTSTAIATGDTSGPGKPSGALLFGVDVALLMFCISASIGLLEAFL